MAQAFEDSIEDIQKHRFACDTMNIHMQRQTTGMPYLLKDKQCIQQINSTETSGTSHMQINAAVSQTQLFQIGAFASIEGLH